MMLTPGDIVLVAFPYAESGRQKYRPALVVSTKEFHKRHGVCWVAMITSAENAAWPGDIKIPKELLDKPSVIRPAKLATLDIGKVEKIGVVPNAILNKAARFIQQSLAA